MTGKARASKRLLIYSVLTVGMAAVAWLYALSFDQGSEEVRSRVGCHVRWCLGTSSADITAGKNKKPLR
jgi:hypothetical protein